MGNTNYIQAELYITEEDIFNNKIRIINSFENVKKEKQRKDEKDDYKYENEEEIKKCRIKINGKLISFCYFYEFPKKGHYTIEYLFSNKLTNISLCSMDVNLYVILIYLILIQKI